MRVKTVKAFTQSVNRVSFPVCPESIHIIFYNSKEIIGV